MSNQISISTILFIQNLKWNAIILFQELSCIQNKTKVCVTNAKRYCCKLFTCLPNAITVSQFHIKAVLQLNKGGQHHYAIFIKKVLAGFLLIGPLGTNFNEILIGIRTIAFKKMHLKMSSAKRCPLCLGFNVVRMAFIRMQCYLNRTCFIDSFTFIIYHVK